MSSIEGFYNIVTDGTYFYTSNAYRNVVCKITQSGEIDYSFIVIESPLCLAITNYTNKKQKLFVQTYYSIIVYEFVTSLTVVKVKVIPYLSSTQYPSMFHHTTEDKLYISNYSEGTLTTIDNSYISSVAYINPLLKGISGMVLASNLIYLSNYDENKIYVIDQGVLRPYLQVTYPRGLHYSNGNFYISYGEGDNNGILVHTYGTDSYLSVFSDYLFNTVPINTLLFSNNLYITLEKSNVIYKNKSFFCAGNFLNSILYTEPRITTSVIARNASCLENPSFSGLIQLRTFGSNPNNPIPPVTTLDGRLQGNQIPFNIGLGSDYESLKMRRKAETLKFRNSNNAGITLTTKQLYTNIVKNGGAYHFSRTRLNQLLDANNGRLPCDIGVNNGNPIVISSPNNSGINDSTFEGYYLNPYIPYYPSL